MTERLLARMRDRVVQQRSEQWQAVADARERQESRQRARRHEIGFLANELDEFNPLRSYIGRWGWLWSGLVLGAIVVTLWVLYWLSCGATLARECRS